MSQPDLVLKSGKLAILVHICLFQYISTFVYFIIFKALYLGSFHAYFMVYTVWQASLKSDLGESGYLICRKTWPVSALIYTVSVICGSVCCFNVAKSNTIPNRLTTFWDLWSFLPPSLKSPMIAWLHSRILRTRVNWELIFITIGVRWISVGCWLVGVRWQFVEGLLGIFRGSWWYFRGRLGILFLRSLLGLSIGGPDGMSGVGWGALPGVSVGGLHWGSPSRVSIRVCIRCPSEVHRGSIEHWGHGFDVFF